MAKKKAAYPKDTKKPQAGKKPMPFGKKQAAKK